MLTFKKLKKKSGLFTDDQLQLALKSTLEDGISIRKATKEFHVPKSTLADYRVSVKLLYSLTSYYTVRLYSNFTDTLYIRRAKMSGKKSVPKMSMTTMLVD